MSSSKKIFYFILFYENHRFNRIKLYKFFNCTIVNAYKKPQIYNKIDKIFKSCLLNLQRY
jgi:hypothetical protein